MHLPSYAFSLFLTNFLADVIAAPENLSRSPVDVTITLTKRIAVCEPSTRTNPLTSSPGIFLNSSSTSSVAPTISIESPTLVTSTGNETHSRLESSSLASGSLFSFSGTGTTSLVTGNTSTSVPSANSSPFSSSGIYSSSTSNVPLATSTTADRFTSTTTSASSTTPVTGTSVASSATTSSTTPATIINSTSRNTQTSSGTTSSTSALSSSSILSPATSRTTGDPSTSSSTLTTSPLGSTTSSSTPTTLRSSSATTSNPSCIPSPTQAIINPSFELDLDLSGRYTSPWTFAGNALVQLSTPDNQAAIGIHYALLSGGGAPDILSGSGSTTTSISQSLSNLVPGSQYTLQYYYNVLQIVPQTICRFTASITDGVVLDSVVSSGSPTGQYLVRAVTYTPVSASARLEFSLGCPSSILGIPQIVVALDEITLTRAEGGGC